ncbi:purine-cytosine permease family protein [Endozoicomonadaceae bacterium StTr2]
MTYRKDTPRPAQPNPRELAEPFGIETVPEIFRAARWYDIFNIVVNYLINPGTLITAGMAVVAGLPVWVVIAVQAGAIFVSMIPYLLMAGAGVRYSLPGQVICRSAFGIQGSRYITSLLRMLCSVYWFAFQTLAGAMALQVVIKAGLGFELSLAAIAVGFAIIQALVAVSGYRSLCQLGCWSFPLKLVLFSYLFYLLFNAPQQSLLPEDLLLFSTQSGNDITIWLWANAIFASTLSLITDAADFTRHMKSHREMWFGSLLGAVTGTLLGAAFGACIVAMSGGTEANPFAVLTTMISSPVALLAMALVIILDNWTINAINLYTGGLSLCNLTEGWGRRVTTWLISILALLLCLLPDTVWSIQQMMTAMGALFAPITGILITDYIVLRKQCLDPIELLNPNGCYRFFYGFNPQALVWLLAGYVAHEWLLDEVALRSVVTLLLTGCGYAVTSWLVQYAFNISGQKSPQQWTTRCLK